MPEVTIEFVKQDSPEEPCLLCEPIVSRDPLLVPAVGDVVYINEEGRQFWLRIDHRRIGYGPDWTHVEVFCSKVPLDQLDRSQKAIV
jgi:hypothetical protein